MTRQRRHVNGSSNAVAPVDTPASLMWGSGRTVPVSITSTSKRDIPPPIFNAASDFNALKTDKLQKSIARRPQSSRIGGSREFLAGSRPKRRVQSARGSGDKDNIRSRAAAAQDTAIQSIGDDILPKLQPQVSGILKSRIGDLQHRPTPPTSIVSAAGIDAKSHVQWAVKVETTTPVEQTTSLLEPTEMKDLRRLLRDRYGEKRSVRQAFLTWDINKDGRLCVQELQDMLKQIGFAHVLGPKKMEAILQHVLAMPKESLHYDDFCSFVCEAPVLPNSSRRTTGGSKVDGDIVPTSDPDCVVSLLRSKYESRRVHQVFRDWDIDKNGGVTMAEIESNLLRQGLRIAKPQLMKLFDTYDLNHDGRLMYDEFMRLVYGPVHEQRYSYLAEQRRKKQRERQLQEGDPFDFFRRPTVPQHTSHSADDPGFRATLQRKLKAFASRLNDAYAAFDDDHDGSVSYRELCHGLQEMGLSLTEREFLHLAACVDTDGNGEISFKEFCDTFRGGEASNPRRRSAPADDEEDERVEEQTTRCPKAKDNRQQRCSPGMFNFSHLTRRAKIPTRCGRTPYPNTSGIISSNQDGHANSSRFLTEAQLYGSGSFCRSGVAAEGSVTLGQEEKQRRDIATTNRLQRLRVQMEQYEDQARPLQDSYNLAQERRVRTLRRHQERYHQRIEEQRPRLTLSPQRKGIPNSTAPFV